MLLSKVYTQVNMALVFDCRFTAGWYNCCRVSPPLLNSYQSDDSYNIKTVVDLTASGPTRSPDIDIISPILQYGQGVTSLVIPVSFGGNPYTCVR